MESGKFESIGSGMYSLIRKTEAGSEESVFGIEYEFGKGAWVYNNTGEPVMNLDELKQLRDILNNIIEIEESE